MLSELFTLLLLPLEFLLRRRLTEREIAAFYKSLEWKKLRYEALKRYGRVCRCCRTADGKIVIDHIKPVRTHPHLRLKLSNLQPLCASCNRGKGSHCARDWR